MQSCSKLSLIAPFPPTQKCGVWEREGVSLRLQGRGRRSVSMTFCYPASNTLLTDETDYMRQAKEQLVMSPLFSVRPYKIFKERTRIYNTSWSFPFKICHFWHLKIMNFLLPFLFHMAFLCQDRRWGGKKKKKRHIKEKHFSGPHEAGWSLVCASSH